MKPRVLVLGLLLVLTGCAPTTAPKAEPTTKAPVEVVYATEAQVASVIAEYEPTWREVIADAGDCRFVWTLGTTTLDEMQGFSCYLQEQTIGITAQLVVRDFEALDIPPSMTSIVSSSTALLAQISAIDLKSLCGEGELPVESTECNEAFGGRNFLYNQLAKELDAWSPYL